MNLEEVRRNLDKKKAMKAVLKQRLQDRRLRLREAEEQVEEAQKAQKVLQEIAEEVQNFTHRKIAAIVSRFLTTIFGEEWELKVEFEQKRGKTEAVFSYYCEGKRVNPRVSSGGMMQMAALALRLASLLLGTAKRRRLLVLDEPFQGLDGSRLEKMGELLESLAEELDMQIILVTHSEYLRIGKVIHL